MTAKLDPYSASPGTFSTTSVCRLTEAPAVERQLALWLKSWVKLNQGDILKAEVGGINAPEGVPLPFGWIMVWVEVTAAVPDEEPGEVVLEDAPEPEPEEEPVCGFQIGGPGEQPCRCHLERGHRDLHQCRHSAPSPEVYPGLHGSHKPGCVLAPAHREAGTLACYGTDHLGRKGMWL